MTQQINIDLTESTITNCIECGMGLFNKVFRLRNVSSVARCNPTGKDIPIEIPAFTCANCGHEVGMPAKHHKV